MVMMSDCRPAAHIPCSLFEVARSEEPQVVQNDSSESILQAVLSKDSSRRIFYFLLVNLAYMMVQILFGWYSNSLGLISDSIHMFFDCLALALGLVASVIAKWPPSKHFPYGYERIETLSGFSNGIFLGALSVMIIFEALERLSDPPALEMNGLLGVSIGGLLVNLGGVVVLGGHGHAHGHVCSHGHTHGHEVTRSHSCGSSENDERKHPSNSQPFTEHHLQDSVVHNGHCHHHESIASAHLQEGSHSHDANLHGVLLHVLADTLGSLGVILSTVLIKTVGWYGFDPIASIFIAVMIMIGVSSSISSCARVLCCSIDKRMEKEIAAALRELSQQLPEYKTIDYQVISLDPGRHILVLRLLRPQLPSPQEQRPDKEVEAMANRVLNRHISRLAKTIIKLTAKEVPISTSPDSRL